MKRIPWKNLHEILKVGDRVQLFLDKDWLVPSYDFVVTGFDPVSKDLLGGHGNKVCHTWNYMCGGYALVHSYEETDTKINPLKPETNIPNVIEFFKNLTAGADDKLLMKHGIENPVGVPTEEGLRLSAMISYKGNRDEVVWIVKKLDAELEEGKK